VVAAGSATVESSGTIEAAWSGTVVESSSSIVASTRASGIEVVDAGSGSSGGSGSSDSGAADSDPIAGISPAKPATAAIVTPHRARRAGCDFRGTRSRFRSAVGAASASTAATDSVTCFAATPTGGGPHGDAAAGDGAGAGTGASTGAATAGMPRLARRRASRSSVVSSGIVDLSSRP
jgi:hypothetical protein